MYGACLRDTGSGCKRGRGRHTTASRYRGHCRTANVYECAPSNCRQSTADGTVGAAGLVAAFAQRTIGMRLEQQTRRETPK